MSVGTRQCQLMAGLLPKELLLDTGEPGPLDGNDGRAVAEAVRETIRAIQTRTIDAKAD